MADTPVTREEFEAARKEWKKLEKRAKKNGFSGSTASAEPKTKKKSAYNIFVGKKLKELRIAHPDKTAFPQSKLMTMAAAAWKEQK
jgi:hypothetical protein